jgi:hypothetical protein
VFDGDTAVFHFLGQSKTQEGPFRFDQFSWGRTPLGVLLFKVIVLVNIPLG